MSSNQNSAKMYKKNSQIATHLPALLQTDESGQSQTKKPLCIFCQQGKESGTLIEPCSCPPQSNLNRFHYRCLTSYMMIHLDAPCPNCGSKYSDIRIKRYRQDRRLLDYMKALLIKPIPFKEMRAVYGILVISLSLFYLAINCRGPIKWILFVKSLVLFIFLVDCFDASYNMWRGGWPHDLIRFYEYHGAPNGIIIFDLTEAKCHAKLQQMQQMHQAQQLEIQQAYEKTRRRKQC